MSDVKVTLKFTLEADKPDLDKICSAIRSILSSEEARKYFVDAGTHALYGLVWDLSIPPEKK